MYLKNNPGFTGKQKTVLSFEIDLSKKGQEVSPEESKRGTVMAGYLFSLS